MTSRVVSHSTDTAEAKHFLGETWFSPLESGVRSRTHAFVEERPVRRALSALIAEAVGKDVGSRAWRAKQG